jgi:phenylacetate-coenzyme A ligase PaaK-like adenylate-forming protein
MRSSTSVFALPAEPAYDPVRWAEAAFDVWQAGHLSRAGLERAGTRRLQALVDFARETSPYYSRLYRRLPRQGLALTELPPVDKGALMRHFDDVVTGPVTRREVEAFAADAGRVGELLHGRYAVFSTSGTTGTPGWFLHDADALAVYDALELQRGRGMNSPAELVRWQLEGERYAMVAATGGHFAGVATIERARRWAPWLAATIRTVSLMQPLPELVAELNAFRPTIIASYPTVLELLADERTSGRLRARPREIWCGGEVLSAAARTRIAGGFGCAVRSVYGASEFLPIAWECAHRSLHVNLDWVLLEPIDARGRPLPPDVRSHSVLLTNLANRIQPLIRYNLGDGATLRSARCTCGSAMPVIVVEGRSDDVLRLPARDGGEVAIVPLALATVLEEEAGVHDFQVVQSAAQTVDVRLAAHDRRHARRVRDALARHFAVHGAADVKIDIVHGEPVRETRGGKLRRVIGRLPH